MPCVRLVCGHRVQCDTVRSANISVVRGGTDSTLHSEPVFQRNQTMWHRLQPVGIEATLAYKSCGKGETRLALRLDCASAEWPTGDVTASSLCHRVWVRLVCGHRVQCDAVRSAGRCSGVPVLEGLVCFRLASRRGKPEADQPAHGDRASGSATLTRRGAWRSAHRVPSAVVQAPRLHLTCRRGEC